jgi:hypothetical protein
MNKGSSKSLLPLVEIIVAVGIFAIAVVLTLQLFLLAKFLGDKTSDTAKAMFEVQQIAENIKGLNSRDEINDYVKDVLYYDAGWNYTGDESKAEFILKIDTGVDEYETGSLYKFRLDFYKAGAYPFIEDKKLEENKDYIPLLVSIDANKFISGQK